MPVIRAADFAAWLSAELKKDTETVRKAAVDTCLWGERRAVRLTDDLHAVDQGLFRLSWAVSQALRDKAIELRNDAPYAGIIEHGRRPGRAGPPLAPIYEWVQRKFRHQERANYRAAKSLAIGLARSKAAGWSGPVQGKTAAGYARALAAARRRAAADAEREVRREFGSEEGALNARLWKIAFDVREAIHVRGIKPKFILRTTFGEMRKRLIPEAIRRLRRAHRNRG